MKALKFYDKEGVAFELFVDHEKHSVTMQVEPTDGESCIAVEFDDEDLDDIIISLVELKNELVAAKRMNDN